MPNIALHPEVERLGAPAGSVCHYALLRVPAPLKDAMVALSALHQSFEQILTEVREPHVQHVKFAFWAEEFQRLRQGSGQHPITLEALRLEMPECIITGMESMLRAFQHQASIIDTPPHTQETNHQGHERIGMLWIVWSMLEYAEPEAQTLEALCHAAEAYQKTLNILNLRRHAEHGRWPIAGATLTDYGIDSKDLYHHFRENSEALKKWWKAERAELSASLDDHHQRLKSFSGTVPHVVRVQLKIARQIFGSLSDEPRELLTQTPRLQPLKALWYNLRG